MPIAAFMPVAEEFDRVSVSAFGVDPATLAVFRDCFNDFRISAQLHPLHPAQIGKKPIDACILQLDAPDTPAVLSAIRHSDLQKRCVIFGMGSQEAAIRLAREGINALVESPTTREINSAIRVTYLLLVHRLRKHVRIPLVVHVRIEADHEIVQGITRDISAGGLNITAETGMAMGRRVRVAFTVPERLDFDLEGVVCWSGGKSFGVALLPSPNQERLRKWSEEYLLVEDSAGSASMQ